MFVFTIRRLKQYSFSDDTLLLLLIEYFFIIPEAALAKESKSSSSVIPTDISQEEYKPFTVVAVTTTSPALFPKTFPLSTEAIDSSLLIHVTLLSVAFSGDASAFKDKL